jgi:hypothetical protein
MTLRAFSILTLIFSAGIAEASGADEANKGAGLSWSQTPPPPSLPAADLLAGHSEKGDWYGAQLIVSDVLSAGLVAAGYGLVSASPSCPGGSWCLVPENVVYGATLGSLGVAGLTLVAPITHLARGQGIAAAESVVLRILLPLAAGFIAAQTVHNRVDFYGPGNTNAPMVAATIALGVGAIIDDAFLSSNPG